MCAWQPYSYYHAPVAYRCFLKYGWRHRSILLSVTSKCMSFSIAIVNQNILSCGCGVLNRYQYIPGLRSCLLFFRWFWERNFNVTAVGLWRKLPHGNFNNYGPKLFVITNVSIVVSTIPHGTCQSWLKIVLSWNLTN